MSHPYKWTGPLPQPAIATWAYKKDMPQVRINETVLRIQFRFSIAYCILCGSNIKLTNGDWMPIFQAILITPGRVIGMRDLTTADQKPWAEEWRGALGEKIQAQIDLHFA
jgi:hypothetical protein